MFRILIIQKLIFLEKLAVFIRNFTKSINLLFLDISRSNKSSNSLKHSIDIGNPGMAKTKEYKTIQQKIAEKENLSMKTDRVPSSDFKNINNIKAPQKAFTNKNAVLMNNYLKSSSLEDDFEDLLKRNRNYNF